MRRVRSRPARWAVGIVPMLFAAACNELPPESVPPPPPPPGLALLLSDPVTIPPGAAPLLANATDNSNLIFLSLQPGAAPTGQSIRIKVERTGAELEAPLVGGGLDPVILSALAGDTLRVTLRETSGSLTVIRAAVPPRKPPVIVRTEPRKNRRDVPLNASIVVVFSEPVDPATLGPGDITVRAGSTAVPGRVSFVNGEHTLVAFVPDGPLKAGTDYELVVGAGVRDIQGNPLEEAANVSFTTLPALPDNPPSAGPLVVSNVVAGSAWISMPTRSWPTAAGALNVRLRIQRTGVEIIAPMVMEGVDPVAVAAIPGDSVIASVHGFGGLLAEYRFAIPLARQPVLIRSVPRAADSAFPAGQPLKVVFSEPMAPSILSPGTISLVRSGVPVAVQPSFADETHTVVLLVPEQPLPAGAFHEIMIGSEARDTDGQSVGAPIRVDFRTAATLGNIGQLAFVRDGQIFLVRTDGSGLTQLTAAAGVEHASPAWSPNGQRIAFSRSDGEDQDIYIMDADGGNVSRRTFGGYNAEPTWSPDGTRIAFTRLEEGSAGIFSIAAAGPTGIQEILNRPGYDANPDWSPDGTRVTFVSDWRAYDFFYDLYVVDATGANVRSVLENPFFANPTTYYFEPDWSPDGSRIAVTVCLGWSYWTCYPNTGIGIVNPDGTGFQTVTGTATGIFAAPTWSPDGAFIAFHALDCPDGCPPSLRFARTDGTAKGFILTNGHSPAWRPTP